MTRDEILAEIIECPREAFVLLPDMQVVVRPGWRQLLTPSIKRGGLNEVSFAQVAEVDAERVIDETIAQYRAHGCKFVWRLGPDSSPHLGARLAARGLPYTRSDGMARSTQMDVAIDPRITIERVDADSVDIYTRTMAAGWDMDPGPIAVANELVARLPQPARHNLFLARWDGEPAATAGAAIFARSIYLIGGVTLEAFRGRGLYRALVSARLAFARERGVSLATSHARADTSAPILERLGFETLCHYDNYSFTP
ncbi:MAG: GNAT family N-acetyltransferase [Myxococcota bacterium]|nr:GNAT family N-acetyltransferase [Deltaproteobacteria bacterium]MDQ3339905.1 GNAT family N-acetyltransferase [Myxococcota bacterium]